MRTIQLTAIIVSALLILSGCKKDNYAAPDGGIHGALIDGETGDSLQLSEAGNNSTVRMIVNDPAKYPAPSNLDLSVKQDGAYDNTLVFPETYKVIPVAQSGPWQYLSGDTTSITIAHGQNVEVNFKVVPFFRISTPTVQDSTVTFTITKSAITTVTNNLTGSGNLLILVNNYPIVDESVCSNQAGQYYQNQFRYTVTNSVLGNPMPYTFSFSAMHLSHGTYYLRTAIVGSGSNGKYNYSPIVQIQL